MDQRPPPIDLPDDDGQDYYAEHHGNLLTMLTGIGIGIFLGLALAELWSIMGGAA